MMHKPALAPADIELVASIRGGQAEAEAALYERYSARVYYVALRESRSPQDAEDVRTETFLRVLQAVRADHLRSAESLPSFILSTTRNVLHELFRRRQAEKAAQAEAAVRAVPWHEEEFLDADVQHAIERTIVRLKPRERDFLRMHFYEELPRAEIARRSGIPEERVRLVKSRALKRFRELYQRLNKATASKRIDTRRG